MELRWPWKSGKSFGIADATRSHSTVGGKGEGPALRPRISLMGQQVWEPSLLWSWASGAAGSRTGQRMCREPALRFAWFSEGC